MMSLPTRSFFKFGGAILLVVFAVGFVCFRFVRFQQAGEARAKVWFYDQNSKHLYAVPRETIPPDPNDANGVRAIVVAYRGEERDPTKRHIAFLETYGPELKQLLERFEAARAAGHTFQEHIPSRDSEFFQTNDLVKRLQDPEWHPSSSTEGQKILSEWRSSRGPLGQTPVVCLP